MPSPSKNKDDLWAEFREKSGAGKHVVSGRTLALLLIVVLMAVATFTLA